MLVLEAADAPGGAVRTEELTLPGFHHDTFSSVYPAAVASPVFARMPLAEHGLEWVHPEACYAHPLPGGEATVLYRDLDRTAAIRPRRRRWARVRQPFLDNFDAVRATMLTGFPPVGGPLKLLAGAGPLRLLDFARMLPTRAVGLGKRLFEDGGSRAWLYGAALHGDTPPDGAGSAIAAFYLNLLGHAVGWPSPRGGAERLTDALVAYLSSLGGEIRTGARVERSAQRATAGSPASDRRRASTGRRTVIADLMPQRAGAHGRPARLVPHARCSRYVLGAATVKVDWALDGPIPWANAAMCAAPAPSTSPAARTSSCARSSRPRRASPTSRSCCSASRASPTRRARRRASTPPGPTRTARRTRPGRDAHRRAHGGPGRALRARLPRPHPRPPRPRARPTSRPATRTCRRRRRRRLLPPRQVVFRPVPKLNPYKTPLKGLFIGSAATFPGGAVHGVPGDAAARAALRKT